MDEKPHGLPCALVKLVAVTLLALGAAVVFAASAQAGDDDDDRGDRGDRKFFLTGTARPDRDPENRENEVIRLTSAFDPLNPRAAQFGAVARVFKEKTRVPELDNMLENKHRFKAPHSCGVGSPRMALAIDRDGDGDSDGNAFGYFGTSPAFSGCPPEVWLYEDYTGPDSISGLSTAPGPSFPAPGTLGPSLAGGFPNEQLEWDITQFGGPFYNTWSMVETFFSAHPRHRICAARYVDDFGTPPGTGHADLITMGDAVLEDHEDIAGRADPFKDDPCKFSRDDDDDDDGDDDDERQHMRRRFGDD